jgi:virginiamycin B lyase
VHKVIGWSSLVLFLGTVATVAPMVATSTASAAAPGDVTNFSSGVAGPGGIVSGPDGALWFANGTTNSIGRITTDGTITDFTDPNALVNGSITAGPDGALWFAEANINVERWAIGRITTDGTITNFTDPSIGMPNGITAGPDGAV